MCEQYPFFTLLEITFYKAETSALIEYGSSLFDCEYGKFCCNSGFFGQGKNKDFQYLSPRAMIR